MRINNDEIIGYARGDELICLDCAESIEILEDGYEVLTEDSIRDGETLVCDQDDCGQIIGHKE